MSTFPLQCGNKIMHVYEIQNSHRLLSRHSSVIFYFLFAFELL